MTQITHRLNAREQQELIDALSALSRKYFDLVWYARKRPSTDTEYWSKVPAEIREGAFRAMSQVEEDYHEDVIELRGEEGDWQHGFNSGCLAAFRLAVSALSPTTVIDPAFDGEGEPCELDGLATALDFFPDLDT